VLKHFIFSNKIDLSQVIIVVLSKEKTTLKLLSYFKKFESISIFFKDAMFKNVRVYPKRVGSNVLRRKVLVLKGVRVSSFTY